MQDEELTAVGVRSSVGHGDEASTVSPAVERRVRVDLVSEWRAPRALTAAPISRRVATLDHESTHDAVKGQPIVVPVLGEQAEILDGLWRIRREEFDLD